MAKKNNTLIWLSVGAVILYMYFTGNVASAATGASMVSNNQILLTQAYENFSPTAYPDGSANGVQVYSIGYGHQIGPNEQYLMTATITQAQAQQLMLQDGQAIVNVLNNSGIGFTQGQYDALWDFGYSAGQAPLADVLNTLSTNGAGAATAEMNLYIYWHPVPGARRLLIRPW